jgi:hypothetical protein
MTKCRPFSMTDLCSLASYIIGTNKNVEIALSELGYDPQQYPHIRKWLAATGVVFDGHRWKQDISK